MGAIVHVRRPFAVQFEPVRDEPAHLRVKAKVLDVADRPVVAGPPVQPRVPPPYGQRASTGSHGPAGRARQLGQPAALWPSGPAAGATAQPTPSPSEHSSSPYTTSTRRRPQAVCRNRDSRMAHRSERLQRRVDTALRPSAKLNPCRGSGPSPPARPELIRRQIHLKTQGSTSVATREHQGHSRTAILLRFSVRLPPVEPVGRWRERQDAGEGAGWSSAAIDRRVSYSAPYNARTSTEQ